MSRFVWEMKKKKDGGKVAWLFIPRSLICTQGWAEDQKRRFVRGITGPWFFFVPGFIVRILMTALHVFVAAVAHLFLLLGFPFWRYYSFLLKKNDDFGRHHKTHQTSVRLLFSYMITTIFPITSSWNEPFCNGLPVPVLGIFRKGCIFLWPPLLPILFK